MGSTLSIIVLLVCFLSAGGIALYDFMYYKELKKVKKNVGMETPLFITRLILISQNIALIVALLTIIGIGYYVIWR